MRHLLLIIYHKYGIHIADVNDEWHKFHKQALVRLRLACERAKISLSTAPQASIDIDDLLPGINFHHVITRSEFEVLVQGLLVQCVYQIRAALGGYCDVLMSLIINKKTSDRQCGNHRQEY
jgi:hypothetical protein